MHQDIHRSPHKRSYQRSNMDTKRNLSNQTHNSNSSPRKPV